MIVLIETWLDTCTPSSLLGLDNYTIFRRDRHSRGGGIIIAIHNSLSAFEIKTDTNCEILVTEIRCTNLNLTIIGCYSPNNNDTSYLKSFYSDLGKILKNLNKFIIFGDFNSPNVDWYNCYFPNQNNYKFIKNFYFINQPLFQLNKNSTRGSNILDLILSNSHNILRDLSIFPPIGSSDHDVLYGSLLVTIPNHNINVKRFIKSFENANYYAIKTFLENNFKSFIKDSNAKNSWLTFNNFINEIVNSYVPIKTCFYHKNKLIPKIYPICTVQ